MIGALKVIYICTAIALMVTCSVWLAILVRYQGRLARHEALLQRVTAAVLGLSPDGLPTLEVFRCPLCGAESANPNDVEHRYCGRCHVFVDDVTGGPR